MQAAWRSESGWKIRLRSVTRCFWLGVSMIEEWIRSARKVASSKWNTPSKPSRYDLDQSSNSWCVMCVIWPECQRKFDLSMCEIWLSHYTSDSRQITMWNKHAGNQDNVMYVWSLCIKSFRCTPLILILNMAEHSIKAHLMWTMQECMLVCCIW